MRGRYSRELDSSGDTTDDEEKAWTPLKQADYVHLGITICYQCVVLLTVVHLWWCRKWPPYVPRQISLCAISGLAGVLAYVGALIAYGVIYRNEVDFIANCAVEAFFDYVGWGFWTSAALVRVYRSWKILVKHSCAMWPAWGQVLFITIPWFIPVVAYSFNPSLAPFHERGNWCAVNLPIDTTLYVYGALPILSAYGLSYQMRKVRKQMNEFKLQVLQLTFLLMTGTVAFPLAETWLDSRDDIRRMWVMWDNVVSSLILFWPPIAEPLYYYLSGSEDYVLRYTKGFSTLPTPSQMKASLKDQLSIQQLRQEFERFADVKLARELPDFYLACLDRDEIEDFFERQAATTAILDRFVRPGAAQEVNLSETRRQKILSTEITSYNIFTEAMTDVLKMMENNFSADFQETEQFKKLESEVEQEAEELERLRRMNQLPPVDHSERDAGGLLKLIRRVSDSVGGRSSEKGTSSRESDKTPSSRGVPNGSIRHKEDGWLNTLETGDELKESTCERDNTNADDIEYGAGEAMTDEGSYLSNVGIEEAGEREMHAFVAGLSIVQVAEFQEHKYEEDSDDHLEAGGSGNKPHETPVYAQTPPPQENSGRSRKAFEDLPSTTASTTVVAGVPTFQSAATVGSSVVDLDSTLPFSVNDSTTDNQLYHADYDASMSVGSEGTGVSSCVMEDINRASAIAAAAAVAAAASRATATEADTSSEMIASPTVAVGMSTCFPTPPMVSNAGNRSSWRSPFLAAIGGGDPPRNIGAAVRGLPPLYGGSPLHGDRGNRLGIINTSAVVASPVGMLSEPSSCATSAGEDESSVLWRDQGPPGSRAASVTSDGASSLYDLTAMVGASFLPATTVRSSNVSDSTSGSAVSEVVVAVSPPRRRVTRADSTSRAAPVYPSCLEASPLSQRITGSIQAPPLSSSSHPSGTMVSTSDGDITGDDMGLGEVVRTPGASPRESGLGARGEGGSVHGQGTLRAPVPPLRPRRRRRRTSCCT